MQQFFDVVQTRSGAAIADVRVTVYNSSGGAATLYSDNGVTPKANPVTTNADGEYFFYAANGTYSAAFSSSAYISETRTGILLYDPADGTAVQIGYNEGGTGAVTRTVQTKLQESVSVKDFGAVGNGIADDTAAIQAALAASYNVLFPIGSYLISSTIAIPAKTKVEMQGGYGSSLSDNPATYFIKKSTMTTVGVTLAANSAIFGGGLVGQAGNTGDGIQVIGNNARLSNVSVSKAGGVGVRVGTSGTYSNVNSFELYRVGSFGNGSHGIYIHDGVSVEGADANAGTLYQCTTNFNGGNGIYLGHCFWVSVINCLTESNTGWGLYLSGIDNTSYPECRFATVVGGDYNESNVAGQVYDASYFATFLQPDLGSVPTTATTALQGGGYRSVISASAISNLQGLTVQTDAASPAGRPLTVNAGSAAGITYPARIRQRTTAGNGDGVGLAFQVDPATGTYRDAGVVNVSQRTTNYDLMTFGVNQNGSLYNIFTLNAFTSEVSLSPSTDNAISLGRSALRWSTVYAATGTINTSDERAKQDIAQLDAAEKRVAVALKRMVKKYRFKDAVAIKGDFARIHVGVIAQEVMAAFTAEGLDPMRYGMVCYDQWEATEDQPAGNRYGVRYEELLAFIISAM